MITKFIRKLLGRPDQTDATPTDSATVTQANASRAASNTDANKAIDSASDAGSPENGGPHAHGGSNMTDRSGGRSSRGASESDYKGRDPVVKRRQAAKSVSSRSPAPERKASSGVFNTSGKPRDMPDALSPDAPVVIPADVHRIDPTLISRNAVRVTQGLQEAGYRAFIVGGAVRDLLLGIAPKDFDVATNATPDQVQRLFRRNIKIFRCDAE